MSEQKFREFSMSISNASNSEKIINEVFECKNNFNKIIQDLIGQYSKIENQILQTKIGILQEQKHLLKA